MAAVSIKFLFQTSTEKDMVFTFTFKVFVAEMVSWTVEPDRLSVISKLKSWELVVSRSKPESTTKTPTSVEGVISVRVWVSTRSELALRLVPPPAVEVNTIMVFYS